MPLALVLFLLGFVFATGCQTTGQGASAPQVAPPASIPVQALARNEYVVLDLAVGKATYESATVVDALIGAQSMALYNALSKTEDADLLLTPRYDWTWRQKGKRFEVSATVRGKAVRIKTDQELQKSIPAALQAEEQD